MLIENDQEILLGNSIPLPEDDTDDDNTSIDDQLSALYGYWQATILNSISKKNFKSNYNTVISDIIKHVPLEEQIPFCYKILEKIYETYEFEFPEKIEIQTKDHVLELYDFLKFIEFDHEDFVLSVWSFIEVDLATKTLLEFCLDNDKRIMREVEESLETSAYSELISIFLRTYIKEWFMRWFYNATIRYESEIKIRMMEEI